MSCLRAVRLAVVAASHAALGVASAQSRPASRPLVEVEVGDSIGLPLPDAKVETFTVMEGGSFLEWVTVDPGQLPEGIYLLRFSYPGYRTEILSVPLRKTRTVSLRIRLGSAPDSTKRGKTAEATLVRALGLVLAGSASTDIIRTRRLLDRDAIEQTKSESINEVLRAARGTDLILTRATNGDYGVTWPQGGGPSGCILPAMINGDQRWLLPFAEVDRRYVAEDLEAAELIPRGAAVPYARRPEQATCGLMLLWFRPR